MANTTFRGPLRVGSVRGVNDEVGTVVVNQVATIGNTASGATAIRLPANCRVEDISLFIRTAMATSDNGLSARIGTSGAENFFGTIVASAVGVYRFSLGAVDNWFSVNASGNTGVDVHVDVTANGTVAAAPTALDGLLSISYVPR